MVAAFLCASLAFLLVLFVLRRVRFFPAVVFLEVVVFVVGVEIVGVVGGVVFLLVLIVRASVLCICFCLIPVFFRDRRVVSSIM